MTWASFRNKTGSGHGLFVSIEFILNYYSIKFTRENLKFLINNHPGYPSLLTIKEVLAIYNIESLGVRASDFNFSDLVTPFICSIQNENSGELDFTVVTSSDSESVNILNENLLEIKLSIQEFNKIFNDIVLLIDPSNAEDEPGYEENLIKGKQRRKRKIFLFCFSLVTFIFYPTYLFFKNSVNEVLTGGYFYTVGLVGLLLSLLLFFREIGFNFQFVNKVCGENENRNCDVVLKSEWSSFLGLGWTVWGLSYFLSICFSYIFFGFRRDLTEFWMIISIIIFPFIPFSIIYQWKFLKSWCVFCLGIQILLCFNLILSSYYLFSFTWIGFSEVQLPTLIGFFLISLVTLGFLGDFLKEFKTNKLLNMKWGNIKLMEEVFYSVINGSEDVNIPYGEFGIFWGNSEANTEIVFVTNPYCENCFFAHKVLMKIVNRNPDVKLKIAFKVRGDKEDIATLVAANIHSIFDKFGNEKGGEILDYWFKDLDESKSVDYFNHFNIEDELLNNNIAKLRGIRQWCDSMQINVTPTTLINGKKLPDVYRIQDLCYFY